MCVKRVKRDMEGRVYSLGVGGMGECWGCEIGVDSGC